MKYDKPAEFPTIPILFEDSWLLVVNKPAGVVVNRADSVKEYTLQDWMEERFSGDASWEADRAMDEVFLERSGMVHRIDKDTSGVLVFAKRSLVMHELLRQFREREVEKKYWALVHGHLPSREGKIHGAIERNPGNRVKFTVTLTGRDSETWYEVVEEFAPLSVKTLRGHVPAERVHELGIRDLGKEVKLYEGGFSLVELTPKTGRTHQIRVHMDFLHHPLVGDARYTGRKKARLDAAWCPRQWLHARELQVVHPETGKPMSFVAEVPSDLSVVLDLVRVATE